MVVLFDDSVSFVRTAEQCCSNNMIPVTEAALVCVYGTVGVAELLVHGHFTSIDLSIFSFNRILDKKPIREVGIV